MNPLQSGGAASTVPAVVFANAKGGVGKSTLAFLTTVYLASRGIRICFVDCDPQGTGHACISRFVDGRMITTPEREAAGRDGSAGAASLGQLSRTTVDLLVVDTAAGIRPEELKFLRPADLVIVPTSTSDLDLAATRRFVQRLARQGTKRASPGATGVTRSASESAQSGSPQPLAAHLILVPNQARADTDMQAIRNAIPEAHVLKPVYYTAGIQRALHAGDDEAEVLEALRGSNPFFRQLETWVARAKQSR